MKTTKLVNVDRKAWDILRQDFPKLSDSKRSIIAANAVKTLNIKKKLRLELSDTKADRTLKSILNDLI